MSFHSHQRYSLTPRSPSTHNRSRKDTCCGTEDCERLRRRQSQRHTNRTLRGVGGYGGVGWVCMAAWGGWVWRRGRKGTAGAGDSGAGYRVSTTTRRMNEDTRPRPVSQSKVSISPPASLLSSVFHVRLCLRLDEYHVCLPVPVLAMPASLAASRPGIPACVPLANSRASVAL